MPNGIDIGQWLSPTPPSQNGREQLVVAWGRIQYEKGFQVLARAIGHLRHRMPDIRCVIAGRGSYLAELQTQIDMEGVGDIVQLAGFVPDDELRSAAAAHRLRRDPLALRAVRHRRARGHGRRRADHRGPHRWAGRDRRRHRRRACVFEPGNHIALANCIAEVLSHPDVADSMRTKAAALLAGRYTWDAIAATTLGVYNKAKRG